MGGTMNIELQQALRTCKHNTDLQARGETRGLIYDYTVEIDGEHRATWKRNYDGVGYRLVRADNTLPIWRAADEAISVRRKDQMLERTREYLHLIPTLAQYQADQEAKVQRQREEERQEAQDHIRAMREEAGPELYDALKQMLLVFGQGTHTGMAARTLARAQDAIRKAEGE
jgi:hypothetical protein